jgi:restriction system protein
MNKEKLSKLRNLALKRKSDDQSNLSRKYKQVGSFHDGVYDRWDLVSPWTKTACNLNSDIMIIAQDWLSEDSILKYPNALDLGYDPALPTNKNLHLLLREFLKCNFSDVYATNLFVFIKPGGMTEKIPSRDMLYSATKYTIEEIQIINPKFIICLGSGTFNTLCRAIGLGSVDFKKSLDNPISYRESLIYGVPHTGGLGTKYAGGLQNVKNIWSELEKRVIKNDTFDKKEIKENLIMQSNKNAILNFLQSIGAPENIELLTIDEKESNFLASIWINYTLEDGNEVEGNFLLRLRYDEISKIFQVQFWGRDFYQEWLDQESPFPGEKEISASLLANRINDNLTVGSLWLNLDDGTVAFASSMIIAENSLDSQLIQLNIDVLVNVIRRYYPTFKEFISSPGTFDDYERALDAILFSGGSE